jgi:hypothetical protein
MNLPNRFQAVADVLGKPEHPEFRTWQVLTVPFSYKMDWEKFIDLKKYLDDNGVENVVRTTKTWNRHGILQITHYHFFIKDPEQATFVALMM